MVMDELRSRKAIAVAEVALRSRLFAGWGIPDLHVGYRSHLLLHERGKLLLLIHVGEVLRLISEICVLLAIVKAWDVGRELLSAAVCRVLRAQIGFVFER